MSTARSDVALDHPGLPWPIAIRHHPQARRLRLRLDPDNRRLLLTCPPRSNRKAAIDWAVRQRPWVDSELAKLPPGNPFAPGEIIPLEGEESLLVWDEQRPRTIRHDRGQLIGGGPREGFGSIRVEVRIGSTSWRTSLFPETATGTMVLPVKKQVRRAEDLYAGATCDVTVEVVP